MHSGSIKMTVSATLLLLLVAVHSAAAFQYQDCTSGVEPDAKLGSVLISSCPDAQGDRCVLDRGTNASITINFDTVKDFSQAQMSISAKIGPIQIPFIFSPTEACGNYKVKCPAQVGVRQQLVFGLPVARTYPALSTTIRLQLADERKNPIVCIQFPAKLK